jgi:hypothetical protein
MGAEETPMRRAALTSKTGASGAAKSAHSLHWLVIFFGRNFKTRFRLGVEREAVRSTVQKKDEISACLRVACGYIERMSKTAPKSQVARLNKVCGVIVDKREVRFEGKLDRVVNDVFVDGVLHVAAVGDKLLPWILEGVAGRRAA